MHYCSLNLLRGAVLKSFRSPMCSPTKGEVTGRVWSLSPFPRHPPINVDPPRAHPTPLSITRVAGEVSRQKVAFFFPVASHSWLGAAGSRGRQGARPCRGTPIMSATMPLAHCLTKIFSSPLQASLFLLFCTGLSPKVATSLRRTPATPFRSGLSSRPMTSCFSVMRTFPHRSSSRRICHSSSSRF
jgi:hypothetical protein